MPSAKPFNTAGPSTALMVAMLAASTAKTAQSEPTTAQPNGDVVFPDGVDNFENGSDDFDIIICPVPPEAWMSVRQYRCSDSHCGDCELILSAQEGEPAWYWQDDIGISGAYHCQGMSQVLFAPQDELWEFGLDLNTCTKENRSTGEPSYRVWRGCERAGMMPIPKVTWKGHPDGNASLPAFTFEVALVKVNSTSNVKITITARVVNYIAFQGTGHIQGNLLTVDTKDVPFCETEIGSDDSSYATEMFVTEMLGAVTTIEIMDDKSLRVNYGGNKSLALPVSVIPSVPTSAAPTPAGAQRCVPPQLATEYAMATSNGDAADTCSVRAVYVGSGGHKVGDESYHLCLTGDGASWIDYSAQFSDMPNEFFENVSYDCDTRRFRGQVTRPQYARGRLFDYDFRLEFDVERWGRTFDEIVGVMNMYNIDTSGTPVTLQTTWTFPGTRTKVFERLEIGGGSSTSNGLVEIYQCEGSCNAQGSPSPVPGNCEIFQTSNIGEPADYHSDDTVQMGSYECADNGQLVFRTVRSTDIPIALNTCVPQHMDYMNAPGEIGIRVSWLMWRAENACGSVPVVPLVKYDFTGTLAVAGWFWPRYFVDRRAITSAVDDDDAEESEPEETVFVAAAGKTVRGRRGRRLQEPVNRAFRADLATIFGDVPIEHVHILHTGMDRRSMRITFQVDQIAASKGSGWVPPEVTLSDFTNVQAVLSQDEVANLRSEDEPFDLFAAEELPPVTVCPTIRVGAETGEKKLSTVHIVLIAVGGAFIIAIVALSVCACVLKKRLNRAQQSTQLMRTTSEPYGRPVPASSMTAVAGVPIDDPSTLEKAKEVETVKDIDVATVKAVDVELEENPKEDPLDRA